MSVPVEPTTSSAPHPVHSSAQEARSNTADPKVSSSKTTKKEKKVGTSADPSKRPLEVSTFNPLHSLLHLERSFNNRCNRHQNT
jgi:hypothetical protein